MKTPVEFRNNSVQILRLFEVARALEAELAAERAARRRADERAESLALAAHHSAAAAERTEEAESARCAPDFTNVWHNPLDFCTFFARPKGSASDFACCAVTSQDLRREPSRVAEKYPPENLHVKYGFSHFYMSNTDFDILISEKSTHVQDRIQKYTACDCSRFLPARRMLQNT